MTVVLHYEIDIVQDTERCLTLLMDFAIAGRQQQTGSEELGVLCGQPERRTENARFVLPFLVSGIQTVSEEFDGLDNGIFAEG